MFEDFLQYIKDQKLCHKNDRILLALSGGIDSVVMFHLFIRAGYSIGVAHCNFKLRGTDSDADELFVKKLSEKNEIPVFIKKFDTRTYAEEHGLSIQMAARELRYDWFKVLIKEHKYSSIATAHHLNDNVETILFNLIKGTGLKGLTGIPSKINNLIRPLLFAERQQIEQYAKEMNLEYREDQSNLNIKYHRNFIRNKIIPLLEQINPGFVQTSELTLERLSETQKIIENLIESKRNEFMTLKDDNIYLKRDFFKKENSSILLYEVIKPWGFKYDQARSLIRGYSTSESGKLYYSKTHVLNLDRNFMIITSLKDQSDLEYQWFYQSSILETVFGKFFIQKIEKGKEIITDDPNIEYFDFDKVSFPLIVRSWKKGDWFVPLGMKGKKKLSDFMIDRKIPVNLKKRIAIILSGNSIIWIVGYQIDERYKLGSETCNLLKITFKPFYDQSF